jgi:hypothetical protein
VFLQALLLPQCLVLLHSLLGCLSKTLQLLLAVAMCVASLFFPPGVPASPAALTLAWCCFTACCAAIQKHHIICCWQLPCVLLRCAHSLLFLAIAAPNLAATYSTAAVLYQPPTAADAMLLTLCPFLCHSLLLMVISN